MMTTPLLLFVITLAGVQAQPGNSTGDIATAKALYASASFEEALTHLATIKSGAPVEIVEQYRALCLLGLGRATEAEQALERIVVSKPFYQVTDADVSPRFVGMFRDVRKRMLPAAAKTIYARAKAHFDAGDHVNAAREFTTLLALLDDDDLAAEMAALSDLETLAGGFLALSNAALLPKSAPAPTPRVPPPPPPDPGPPAAVIYSIENTDVVPPGDIERRLPPWDATNKVAAATARRGVLEVIIDEKGRVELAILRAPVSPYYDKQLLEAAERWRFKPAMKDGQAVKFRRLFAITLQ